MNLGAVKLRRPPSIKRMKQVWVIDDDPISQDLVAEAMYYIGTDMKVSYFGGYLDFMRSMSYIENYKEEPDFIILDTNEIDHNKLIDQLKDHWKQIPLVLWSENFCRSRRKTLLESGADDVFKKPINLKRAMTLIKGMKNRYLN